MAKNSKENIRKDEEKILEILKTEASKSVDKMAKKCGFSRQKVWRIIKRLEKNKTIWGYSAIVDNSKLGKKKYLFLIRLKPMNMSQDTYNELTTNSKSLKAIEKIAEISSIEFVHGKYDFTISIFAENIKQIKQIQNILLQMFEEKIQKIIVIESLILIEKRGIKSPNVNELKEYLWVK